MKTKIFIVLLSILILNPTLALAQNKNNNQKSNVNSNIRMPKREPLPQYNGGVDTSIRDFLCAPTEDGKDLPRCITRIYRFGIAVGAMALVFFVVWAGYMYMVGGETAKSKAKGMITNSLLGMGLLLGSYVLLSFINPSLVIFRPIQPPIFTAKLPSCEEVGFDKDCVIKAPAGGTITVGAPTELGSKIDQMLMIGFNSKTADDGTDISNILKNSNLGGVILFAGPNVDNMDSSSQITTLIKQLQSQAKTALFVAVDEEGGKVSRLNKAGMSTISSASELGQGTPQSTQTANAGLAKTLRGLGFNVNFAPVLDLSVSGNFMTTDQRTFSSDPDKVAQYGGAVVDGMKSQSVITAGKHFPGLGDVKKNTDTNSVVKLPHNENALKPYKTLSGKLPGVMMAHVIDTGVDAQLPASVSQANYQELRSKLGFQGVTFTDDLDATSIRGVYGSTGKLAVAAVKAGADVLIFSNNLKNGYNKNVLFEARSAIEQAVKSGEIPQSQIDAAYNRITSLKASYNIRK